MRTCKITRAPSSCCDGTPQTHLHSSGSSRENGRLSTRMQSRWRSRCRDCWAAWWTYKYMYTLFKYLILVEFPIFSIKHWLVLLYSEILNKCDFVHRPPWRDWSSSMPPPYLHDQSICWISAITIDVLCHHEMSVLYDYVIYNYSYS